MFQVNKVEMGGWSCCKLSWEILSMTTAAEDWQPKVNIWFSTQTWPLNHIVKHRLMDVKQKIQFSWGGNSFESKILKYFNFLLFNIYVWPILLCLSVSWSNHLSSVSLVQSSPTGMQLPWRQASYGYKCLWISLTAEWVWAFICRTRSW